MYLRKVTYNESLDTVWNELVYTRARLEADNDARDLAPPFQDVIGRLFTVKQTQYRMWEGEVVAHARVDHVDYFLDETINTFATTLDRIVRNDHRNPRWTRYFGTDTPGTIRRMGLQSEIRRIPNWVDSLKTETEADLKQLGTTFEHIVNDARDALTARDKAVAARADYRAREIMTFVDDVNAYRMSIYGDLVTRATENKHHRGWPDEFFYHTTNRPHPHNADTTVTDDQTR
jgi:hypothetical protein